MTSLLFLSFAVVSVIAISVCGGIPHDMIKSNENRVNVERGDNSVEIPLWFRHLFSALKQSVHGEVSRNYEEVKVHSTKIQSPVISGPKHEEELALPVLIHKAEELSGITVSHSTISVAEKSNPFIRTKRSSNCGILANLPYVVRGLSTHLNSNQLIGLNPQTQSGNNIPAGQPSQCHDDVTNKWWPGSEINLRSTCPWNLTEVDLGENAFPRYINKAVCLCVSCIGSQTMRCEETKQTVSYLYRQSCQDGLAVMEQRNITITVGCHCARAAPETGNSREAPITP